MITSAEERSPGGAGLAPAFAAARARLGLIALLFALAAVGWWWTVDEMQGMDGGTLDGSRDARLVRRRLGRDDGGDDVPVGGANGCALLADDEDPVSDCAASLHHRLSHRLDERRRARLRGRVRRRPVSGDVFAWDRAGRWVAGATLIVAAVYELTPLKDVCLGKCRSPLGFLLGSWRPGHSGALQMGARHGAWCIGCCWALMASLFALGVMSVVWMAVVAGFIAFEKLIPSQRAATYGTAGILLVLGVLMLAAPDAVPALKVPGNDPMPEMNQMSPSP